MTVTTAPTAKEIPVQPPATDLRDSELPQYSLRQILGVWAAVTIPMSVLGWIVAPWLSHRLDGRDPFIDALLISFNVGLLWMITLVLILVWREQGSLAWPRVRDALWLRAPQDPKTGRVGGKVWWWALFFTVLSAGVNALPIDPIGPLPRDLPNAIGTDRLAHYFSGNWVGFGLVVAVAFLAPVAEELVFRGLLLPRIRAVFGRGDVIASGVLFTLYHLHQPWSMPATLIDGIVSQAYPTRRFRSTWMGLITHTAPSFLIVGALVFLVI
ncbi:MAG: CPBP family intramembrane glutamic endopeptidase [Actinomycetes bacterium]